MKNFKQKRLARAALAFCLALLFSIFAVIGGAAAGFNMIGRNRRTAETADPPPIGEGIEDGVNGIVNGVESGVGDIIDGVESGAEGIMDGAESIVDGVESDMHDGFETNIPDSHIGGALEDNDGDGISDPTDSDDDNDGVPDVTDTDRDNDGISDKDDPDPDGDGVDESKMTSTLMGVGITVLAVAGVAILVYVLIPKKKGR